MRRPAAAAFLRRAMTLGVRFFDTSSMYGQGDAERALALLNGLPDEGAPVRICTKGGYVGRDREWLLRMLKPLIQTSRGLRGRGGGPAGSGVGGGGEMGFGLRQDFSVEAMRASMERSRRRTGRTRLDYFLLHDPPAAVFDGGGLVEALEEWQEAGWIGAWGIGTSRMDGIAACLETGAPQVLETAVHRGNLEKVRPLLEECGARGVKVIANSILHEGPRSMEGITETYRMLLELPGVEVLLTGTTSAQHLELNVEAFRKAGGLSAVD